MTVIESDQLLIHKEASFVFDFLATPANYRVLMPSSVSDFEVDGDHVSMNLKGLGKLVLGITEKTPYSRIKIIPVSSAPFDFFLEWTLESQGENTKAAVRIEADLNMMMKMMVQGFLKDFVNSQVLKLKKQMEV